MRLNTNFGGGNAADFYPFIPGVNNAGFQLSVGGTPRLVIRGDSPVAGNVGIGTTVPGARLESLVTTGGDIPLRLNTSFGGGNPVDFYPYIPGVNNAGFQLSVGGTARLTITAGGNVGIGTTTPTNKLQVMGDARIGGEPEDTPNWKMLLFGANAPEQQTFGPEMIRGVGPEPTMQDQNNRRVVLWAGRARQPNDPPGPEQAMFIINSNGWLEWGPGGTRFPEDDQDILLERSGVDQLTLRDTFIVSLPDVPGGDKQPRIALKHDGGGIHFGGGGTQVPDVAITRPSAGVLDVRPIAGPTVFAVDVVSKRVRIGAPPTAPADGDLNNSSISFWVDETMVTKRLKIRVRLSDGTLKTGSIDLA